MIRYDWEVQWLRWKWVLSWPLVAKSLKCFTLTSLATQLSYLSPLDRPFKSFCASYLPLKIACSLTLVCLLALFSETFWWPKSVFLRLFCSLGVNLGIGFLVHSSSNLSILRAFLPFWSFLGIEAASWPETWREKADTKIEGADWRKGRHGKKDKRSHKASDRH